MTENERPMRADAVRNRTRILDAAHELFAEQGLGTPVDAIAQRAGVGPGSLHRHFPTKKALVAAVVTDRIIETIGMGRNILSQSPSQALPEFLRILFTRVADDRAMIEVIAGSPVDLKGIAPETEIEFHQLLNQMLTEGQAAGTIREGITIADVKVLLTVATTSRDGNGSPERVAEVVIDGLRTHIPRN